MIEHNLLDADEEEWLNLKNKLNEINWNKFIKYDRDINEIVKDFNNKCAEAVSKTMRKKEEKLVINLNPIIKSQER